MMVLNLQRITENDNVILLQNEDWFLSWGYLKGKFHHYKMKIGFYHQINWRGHPTTTKWRLVFICFYHQLCYKMRLGFHMLPSEGQLPLLQNEIGFLHVVFRWAIFLLQNVFRFLKVFHVCMYVCLYVCMYVCVCVCMSVCLYVCMSLCLYVCLSVWMYVCMYMYMYMYMYVYVHVHAYVYVYVYMCMCMCMCMYVYVYVCTCICISTCTCTCICICACVCMYVDIM